MAHVYDILAEKGHDLHTIGEDASVLEATKLMNRHKVGALVVMRGENLSGMFTERDVLTRVVAECKEPGTTKVGQVMTRQVLCCGPDTSIMDARGVMRNKRIRHLPVVARDGKIVGMISIGDLNAWSLADGEATIQYMSGYIYGRA
jgi:CBS domain-containing protein